MAKLGFYEIRTFETLSRDYGVNHVNYETSLYGKKKADTETNAQEDKEKKRNQKSKDKGMLVTAPRTDIRGHTGYLTFAIKF